MAKIEILNFDSARSGSTRRLVEMFPNTIRCGIFGPSGCGKTNVLLTILMHKKPLKSIYLCSRTGFQEKYKVLEDLVDECNKTNKNKISFTHVNVEKLSLPEEIESDSIVIFDDILTEKQDGIANYFTRGRHKNISCFYLAQSYCKIPKKSCIRENFNFLILFRQDNINLRQIFNEHITGTTFEKFRKWSDKCWRHRYGFLTFDEDLDIFRKNLDYQLT